MRVGKTATAIRLAAKKAKTCIVIVPKSLKEQWEEEIVAWNNSECQYIVITKETFRRDWSKLPKYEFVIVDEAHIGFANYKSQLYKALKAYITKHNIVFINALTGTPYTSNSWSVFSLGNLLGRSWSWKEWDRRYYDHIQMGWDTKRKMPRMVPVQKDKSNPKKYAAWMQNEMSIIINSIGITMSLSDISEQAEDEYVKEYFDLTPEQKKIIKENFDPLPIVFFTRCHQLESGTLHGDGYVENKFFGCEKTTRVLEIIKGYRKIAVIARYNLQLDLYKAELASQSYFGKVFLINGATKDKNQIIKEIDACDDCVVLINSMCSAGYSLASIDTMVFASMDFSFVNYTQMCNRIKNMAKNKSCTYIHLLTRSTKDYKSVDQGVYDAVSNKQDFDIQIFKK